MPRDEREPSQTYFLEIVLFLVLKFRQFRSFATLSQCIASATIADAQGAWCRQCVRPPTLPRESGNTTRNHIRTDSPRIAPMYIETVPNRGSRPAYLLRDARRGIQSPRPAPRTRQNARKGPGFRRADSPCGTGAGSCRRSPRSAAPRSKRAESRSRWTRSRPRIRRRCFGCCRRNLQYGAVFPETGTRIGRAEMRPHRSNKGPPASGEVRLSAGTSA